MCTVNYSVLIVKHEQNSRILINIVIDVISFGAVILLPAAIFFYTVHGSCLENVFERNDNVYKKIHEMSLVFFSSSFISGLYVTRFEIKRMIK